MVELPQDAFGKIQAQYQMNARRFPLINAVIQRKQRGWVFVDNIEKPVCAIVITHFGFMQTFEIDNHEHLDFDTDLTNFLSRHDDNLPFYLLWYAPPPKWQKRMDKLGQDQIRRRERTRFIFNERRADYLDSPVQCPPGFDRRLLDENLVAKTGSFKLDISSRFWASFDDFLKNGLGVCLLRDGEIASLCYSACVADGLAEIDIVTRPDYQGQGLATVTAQYFIQECARERIVPTWDCFIDNTASIKLAKKLGFEEEQTYFFYSFNVPIILPTL